MLVLLSDLLDPIFTVETHADGLIGLNELVKFLGEILILELQHSDVIVKSIDFSLKGSILVE